jgi:translation initiation factor 1
MSNQKNKNQSNSQFNSKASESNFKTVWSDGLGDLRKKSPDNSANLKTAQDSKLSIDTKNLILNVRRLTSGKGRTVIEISNLPHHKSWCEDLAKTLKKSLGVGGTYKNDYIEIHGEKIELVTQILEKQNLKWKKIGG